MTDQYLLAKTQTNKQTKKETMRLDISFFIVFTGRQQNCGVFFFKFFFKRVRMWSVQAIKKNKKGISY